MIDDIVFMAQFGDSHMIAVAVVMAVAALLIATTAGGDGKK